MNSYLIQLTTSAPVFLTREALALGMDHTAIQREVRSGRWHRLRHGAYTAGELWRTLDPADQRRLVARACYLSARAQVLLSHTTMLDAIGVPVWDPPDVTHLTRTDRKAGRRESGVVQHRGDVRAEDVTRRGGLWMTSGTRTALDCLALGDAEHALVHIDGLVRAGAGESLPVRR